MKSAEMRVSQDTVARAARGWENDAPVVPLGMRHFPEKYCRVAALVGGGSGYVGGRGCGAGGDDGVSRRFCIMGVRFFFCRGHDPIRFWVGPTGASEKTETCTAVELYVQAKKH